MISYDWGRVLLREDLNRTSEKRCRATKNMVRNGYESKGERKQQQIPHPKSGFGMTNGVESDLRIVRRSG